MSTHIDNTVSEVKGQQMSSAVGIVSGSEAFSQQSDKRHCTNPRIFSSSRVYTQRDVATTIISSIDAVFTTDDETIQVQPYELKDPKYSVFNVAIKKEWTNDSSIDGLYAISLYKSLHEYINGQIKKIQDQKEDYNKITIHLSVPTFEKGILSTTTPSLAMRCKLAFVFK
jgi:hypothetical protein